MLFQEILKESFLKKQEKIQKIYSKNLNSLYIYRGLMLFSILPFTILIGIICKKLSLDASFFISSVFIVGFFFLLLFHLTPKNIHTLNKKLKRNKYTIFLHNSQYMMFFNKLKNCHYNEFLDNQKIIFKYIESLPLDRQKKALNMIQDKINLNEHLIKDTKRIVEKQIKEKNNTNQNIKSTVLLKNI